MLGTVNHYGSETVINAFFADVKILTVIQVETDVNTGIQYCCFNKLGEICRLGILSSSGGNLENERCVFLLCSFNDTLYYFHIVYIKCANSVIAL